LSFTPGSDDRAESLGVRRPVELRAGDIENAGDLTPAAASGTERDGGEEPAESGAVSSEASAEEKKSSVDTATPEKKEGETGSMAQAVAVTPPPVSGDVAGDGMPPDRPKKPVLAAVAIGGAVVLAIPILLIGTGSHEGKKQRTAAAANTVLSGGQQPPPGAYVPMSPSATPTPKSTPSPSSSAKHSPKATASADPKHSGKPSSGKHSGKGAGKDSVQALSHHGVPASEKPKSGGNPYALEVHPPYTIGSGKTLRTNRIALTMQRGGNLVLRDKSGKIIWSTGTHKAGVYAEFQSDGNLVIYASGRRAVWAAGTFGHSDATLVLQADDNMVIYAKSNALWATDTSR
jgi:hypothetical protein